MNLSHIHRANLSRRHLKRAKKEAAALYTDISPQEHARYLEVEDGDAYQSSVELAMSMRLDELRREHGYLIND